MCSKLRLKRIMKGFTQYHLEKLTGIQQSLISLYERGIRTPRHEHKEKLGRALKCAPADLFHDVGGDNDRS